MAFQLRTYAFIDRMQPQAAAHVAATCQGDVPVAGMSELYIEVAPGNEIFRCADIALKAADVRPALQVVERGSIDMGEAPPWQAEVTAAGQAVLEYLQLSEIDRIKPTVASAMFVTNVNPYQAQLINKWRKGNLLIPGRSLYVLEVAPAAYVALASNEAEKAADISIVEVRALGRFGRLFISGTESDVKAAAQASTDSLNQLQGRT